MGLESISWEKAPVIYNHAEQGSGQTAFIQ